VHGIEVHEVRTWNFDYFRKIFRFLLHITRGVTRGARGTIPQMPNHCGGQNVSTMSYALPSIQYICFQKKLRFEHGGSNLVSYPRRRLTSLRPYTSRLFSQIGEICLQKYLSIRQTINHKLFNLIYLFISRHEVHSMNTHTLQNAGWKKKQNTERSTRHWSWRNHRVTDTFCNCIEDRTIGLQTHS